MFLVISSFTVANGMADQVKAAFRNRPHLVEREEGFIRLDVFYPQDNLDEIWLLTYWQEEESFVRWKKSHTWRDVHRDIPKGLKLIKGQTWIRRFHHVAS